MNLPPQGHHALSSAIADYRRAHEEARRDSEFQSLCEKVHAIRESDIADMETLWHRAFRSLEKQGVSVHQAATAAEAARILESLTSPGDMVVRSKSNVIEELGLDSVRRITPTDVGDWVAMALHRERTHPVYPALDVPPTDVRDALRARHVETDGTPESMSRAIAACVRRDILRADAGLTGANFVTAQGHMVIVENEGNAALVAHHPKKHIVFAPVNRITATLEGAMTLVRCLCLFAGHAPSAYVNITTGPSRTDDIARTRVSGIQGPEEMHLVVVDNGRRSLLTDRKLGTALRCINCGACLHFCPAYRELGARFGARHIGGYGIVLSHAMGADMHAAFQCFGCEMCDSVCPAGVEVFSSLRKLRLTLGSDANRKIRSDILEKGSAMEDSDVWEVRR